jgi:hypothetical protein
MAMCGNWVGSLDSPWTNMAKMIRLEGRGRPLGEMRAAIRRIPYILMLSVLTAIWFVMVTLPRHLQRAVHPASLVGAKRARWPG